MMKCVVCENPSLCCFCFCPYCGDTEKNCMCKNNDSANCKNNFRSKNKPKRIYSKQFQSASFMVSKDDDWWRLEKWQIGRKKFINLF